MDQPLILIIDDSASERLLLEEALSGYGLLTASTGEEGLRAAAEKNPDLILLSASLKDGSGFEVGRSLKRGFGEEEPPLIFISARAAPEDRIRGLELGAADFICGPLVPGELLARVRNRLEIHRLNRRLRRTNEKLSSALAEIRNQNQTLKKELEAAAAVQRALLPGPAGEIPNLNLEWRLSPSASVAGDLLDWFVLDGSRVGFYVVDVSGHGAASGLLAASIHQALAPRSDRSGLVRTLVPDSGGWAPTPPEEIGRELEKIFPYERFEKYFTLVYGILNHRTGVLSYLTAGHPRPILVPERGELKELETTGPPIGLEAGGFESAEAIMEPGDRLFVYSDGITEAESENGFYGLQRLLETLRAARETDLGGFLDTVMADLAAFQETKAPLDDVACLGLELGREQRRLF